MPTPGYTSLSEDYWWWIARGLLVPTIWGFYKWTCEAPKRTLEKVFGDHVVLADDDAIRKAKGILDIRYPVPVAFIIALGVIGMSFYQGTLLPKPGWWNANFVVCVCSAVIDLPTVIACFLTLLRLWTNVRVFGALLKKVNPEPFHPDGAGGLQPVGQYALSTTIFFGVGGAVAAITEYWLSVRGELSVAYITHLVILFYISFTPIVFLAPLWTAHRAMTEAKDKIVMVISGQLKDTFLHGLSGERVESQTLKEKVDKIESLQKLHIMAKSFPVWPLDTSTFHRFLVTWLLPGLGFVVPKAYEIFRHVILRV